MFDRNGTAISQDATLYTHRFGKGGPEMKCFGYRPTDGNIILAQNRTDKHRIYLTQRQLLTTHLWVVDWKPMPRIKLLEDGWDISGLALDIERLTQHAAVLSLDLQWKMNIDHEAGKLCVDLSTESWRSLPEHLQIAITKQEEEVKEMLLHPDAELITKENQDADDQS